MEYVFYIIAKVDSYRKVVAREYACLEFLQKVRKSQPQVRIPKVELFSDYLLIDPRVFHQLEKLCEEQGVGLERELFVGVVKDRMNAYYVYECLYTIEEAEFTG